jgi:hypothetical protein
VSKKKSVSFDGGPVGFKRPPVEHQFKKGEKPPGSGRKKGSKNYAALIAEIMESSVAGKRDGKKQRIPIKKALLLQAISQALNGTVRDVERVFALVSRLDPQLGQPSEPTQPQMEVRFTKIPGDDW